MGLAHEWHLFKTDVPGRRFRNHKKRMEHQPTALKVALLVLGILLLAAGVFFCFIPGPGTPLIVMGLALIAARWAWLAHKLDHGEPKARAWWHKRKLQREG